MMKVTHDSSADAVYIKFSEGNPEVASTQGEWPIHVDLDQEGNVIGIEVMDAAETLSDKFLRSIDN